MKKQQIIFVTGKGGVGKSVVALALAKKLSLEKKVLLVELGLHSFYADFLGLSIQYRPTPYQANLDIALWSGSDCLKEYALYLLKIEGLYKLFFENRISRALIEIAPALSELSILGKITSGIRGVGPALDYDVIVVDSYATGHMMALLKAPRGMAEAIRFGPMSEQTSTMLATIRDPALSQYFIVTLPEELPAIEADELHREIRAEVGISPQILCNKMWPIDEVQSLRETKTPSMATDESTFIDEVNDLALRQYGWLSYLQHRYPKTKQLPMVFSSDPKEITDTLGEYL